MWGGYIWNSFQLWFGHIDMCRPRCSHSAQTAQKAVRGHYLQKYAIDWSGGLLQLRYCKRWWVEYNDSHTNINYEIFWDIIDIGLYMPTFGLTRFFWDTLYNAYTHISNHHYDIASTLLVLSAVRLMYIRKTLLSMLTLV